MLPLNPSAFMVALIIIPFTFIFWKRKNIYWRSLVKHSMFISLSNIAMKWRNKNRLVKQISLLRAISLLKHWLSSGMRWLCFCLISLVLTEIYWHLLLISGISKVEASIHVINAVNTFMCILRFVFGNIIVITIIDVGSKTE